MPSASNAWRSESPSVCCRTVDHPSGAEHPFPVAQALAARRDRWLVPECRRRVRGEPDVLEPHPSVPALIDVLEDAHTGGPAGLTEPCDHVADVLTPRGRPQEALGRVSRGLEDAVTGRQRVFGELAIGDVVQHSLPHRVPVRRADERSVVVHPSDASVLAHDAMFDLVVLACLVRAVGFGDHARPVIGMDDPHPQAGVGEPFLLRVAGQVLVLRADVASRGDLVDVVDVDDRRKLLNEGPVSLAGLLEPAVGLLARGDVEHDALVAQPAIDPHGHGFVADPDLLPLGGADAVLRRESLRGRDRLGPRMERLGQVVGVHEPTPELRIVQPLLGGVAEHALDLWADVGGRRRSGPVGGVPDVGDRRHLLDHRLVLGLGLRPSNTVGAPAPPLHHGERGTGGGGHDEHAERRSGERGCRLLQGAGDRLEGSARDAGDGQHDRDQRDHEVVPAHRPFQVGLGSGASRIHRRWRYRRRWPTP